MIQSKFNTPNKVREMLKLLLDERVSISEQTEGECAEIIMPKKADIEIKQLCKGKSKK